MNEADGRKEYTSASTATLLTDEDAEKVNGQRDRPEGELDDTGSAASGEVGGGKVCRVPGHQPPQQQGSGESSTSGGVKKTPGPPQPAYSSLIAGNCLFILRFNVLSKPDPKTDPG